jgi:hypothetical protein
MIGGLWLAPKQVVPEGAWVIGTGMIILSLSMVRYLYGLKTPLFWTAMGVIALTSGASDLLGVSLPLFPILLMLVGASVVVKHLSGGGD